MSDVLNDWKQVGRCAFGLVYESDQDGVVIPCPSGPDRYCRTHNPHGQSEPLIPELYQRAYAIGVQRSQAARQRGAPQRYDWKPTLEEGQHVDGMSAMAEQLVAVTTWRRWTSDGLVPDAPEAGDVEGGIFVRWTPYQRGHLIVHPGEPDAAPFVLVVGEQWPLQIIGWCTGAEAKTRGEWKENIRHPCFFVKPWRDIDELKK